MIPGLDHGQGQGPVRDANARSPAATPHAGRSHAAAAGVTPAVVAAVAAGLKPEDL